MRALSRRNPRFRRYPQRRQYQSPQSRRKSPRIRRRRRPDLANATRITGSHTDQTSPKCHRPLSRVSARAHNVHTPNSLSWGRMLYHVDVTTWFLFWVQLDWFISTNVGQPMPMYVHWIVYTPIPPVSIVRKTMYRNFNRLIPPEASMCLSFVRYRLHFYHFTELNSDFRYPHDPNYVSVIHLRMTPFWSPPIHPEDLFYTTLIPPPPVSPPTEQLEYTDNAPTPWCKKESPLNFCFTCQSSCHVFYSRPIPS